ncbi:DUF2512 family protein [Sporosarcina highlanderae]|uniref:DUF2512 family protein n=1 Tax=Sporosarcina highlanderae TaxID=3035916 RepID=A0ABT8JM61_9BACL|nr:DUF2512 family protein [Sporosarcina highlanderae]MDN4606234.1 DUF2512 family protein [Sporosarcina highlanderae]
MTDHHNRDSHLNHTLSLIIKAALVFSVLWIVLSVVYDVSFVHSTIIGVFLLLVSYLGDAIILPKIGNGAATFSDFILAALIIWGGLHILGYRDSFGEAVLTSAIVAVGEYFFHAWMLKKQFRHAQV